MDKIDIRDLIVRDLKENEFGTTDQCGNELRVVEDCDFVEIAERIVENLPIYVIMQQSELLIAFQKYLLLPGVDNMRTDKHRAEAFIHKSNL